MQVNYWDCPFKNYEEHADGFVYACGHPRGFSCELDNKLNGATADCKLLDPLFELGRLVATPGARSRLEELGEPPFDLLKRHSTGDWGDLEGSDAKANERALEDGSRIFSVYRVRETTFWVITEAKDEHGQRGSTCIMLPEEY